MVTSLSTDRSHTGHVRNNSTGDGLPSGTTTTASAPTELLRSASVPINIKSSTDDVRRWSTSSSDDDKAAKLLDPNECYLIKTFETILQFLYKRNSRDGKALFKMMSSLITWRKHRPSSLRNILTRMIFA